MNFNLIITAIAVLFLMGFVFAVSLCLIPSPDPVFNRGDKVKINGKIQGCRAVTGSYTYPVTIKPFNELVFLGETRTRYYFELKDSGYTVNLSKSIFAGLEYRIVN